MSFRTLNRFAVPLALLLCAPCVLAHPQIQDALDAVIHPDKLVLDVRVPMEEVMLVERAADAPPDRWGRLVASHGDYLLSKLFAKADGVGIDGAVTAADPPKSAAAGVSAMATFRIVYPLAKPPSSIELRQGVLEDFPPYSATFASRVRQSTDAEFDTALLRADNALAYTCVWPAAATPTTRDTGLAASGAGSSGEMSPSSRTGVWSTFRDYTIHGVEHITGEFPGGRWDWRTAGLDHLLFAAALVLATTRLWELLKVVTAFTLAHSVTLTLAVVFNRTFLGERIVEPIIAASIVFVALQNVFWPRASHGRARLVVAFGFGLFHGLGFAGALKEAMAGMPASALGSALTGFSFGVELGHQIVVIPLFCLLLATRQWAAPTRPDDAAAGAAEFAVGVAPDVRLGRALDHAPAGVRPARLALPDRIIRYGSCAISVGGVYFLIQALK
jgi:hypothetical protein